MSCGWLIGRGLCSPGVGATGRSSRSGLEPCSRCDVEALQQVGTPAPGRAPVVLGEMAVDAVCSAACISQTVIRLATIRSTMGWRRGGQQTTLNNVGVGSAVDRRKQRAIAWNDHPFQRKLGHPGRPPPPAQARSPRSTIAPSTSPIAGSRATPEANAGGDCRRRLQPALQPTLQRTLQPRASWLAHSAGRSRIWRQRPQMRPCTPSARVCSVTSLS